MHYIFKGTLAIVSPNYDKIYLSLIHRVNAMLFNSVII